MARINILSKKVHKEEYNFDSLFAIDGKYKKFFIASAYSDYKTLSRLFYKIFKKNANEKTNSFKIFIDRSASKIVGNTSLSKNYKTLHTNIRKFCKDNESGIYLVNFNGKLFHTKLVYLETQNSNKIISGSINMTYQGTDPDQNEELVVEHDGISRNLADRILDYFDDINKNSTPVNEITTNKIISARDFFLSGALYYKPEKFNTGQFNLNFPENFNIREPLPKRIQHQSAGSINLFSAWLASRNIGSNESNTGDAPVKNKRDNNNYKNWCIETDFGFFAPYEFKKNVESYSYISDKRNEFYENQILEMIKNKDKFHNDLLEDFNATSEIAKNQGTCWKIDNTSWDKFFYGQMKKFEDSEYRNLIVQRMSSYLIEVPMPDIWNDPFSLLCFKEDFFNFVVSNLKKSKNKVKNYFIKAIIEVNNNPSDFEDLEKILSNDRFSTVLNEFSEYGLEMQNERFNQ